MQAFPNDGASRALRNIFDFDEYTPDSRDLIVDIFRNRGIPLMNSKTGFSVAMGKIIALPEGRVVQSWERGLGLVSATESIGIVIKVGSIILFIGWMEV
jgi:hypothetical protein